MAPGWVVPQASRGDLADTCERHIPRFEHDLVTMSPSPSRVEGHEARKMTYQKGMTLRFCFNNGFPGSKNQHFVMNPLTLLPCLFGRTSEGKNPFNTAVGSSPRQRCVQFRRLLHS